MPIPKQDEVQNPLTTGDARRLMLQTICQIRDDEIGIEKATAMADSMREVTNLLKAEVALMKIQLQAKSQGIDLGDLVEMGKAIIGK